MRRGLRIICLCTLFGVIANVAVGWFFAIRFDLWSSSFCWIEKLGMTYESASLPGELHITWKVGFPMRSLRGESVGRPENQSEKRGFIVIQSAIFESVKGDEAWLPYYPMWIGFVVNTAFWTTMLWSLSFGPVVLRGRIRRRAGRCEQCAYVIGESAVCTECGTAVRRWRDARERSAA